MTDVFDRATEREERCRADALQAQERRAGLTGKTVNDSAFECAVCSAEIPQERRAAYPGTQLCVDCQSELERATR